MSHIPRDSRSVSDPRSYDGSVGETGRGEERGLDSQSRNVRGLV